MRYVFSVHFLNYRKQKFRINASCKTTNKRSLFGNKNPQKIQNLVDHILSQRSLFFFVWQTPLVFHVWECFGAYWNTKLSSFWIEKQKSYWYNMVILMTFILLQCNIINYRINTSKSNKRRLNVVIWQVSQVNACSAVNDKIAQSHIFDVISQINSHRIIKCWNMKCKYIWTAELKTTLKRFKAFLTRGSLFLCT